MFGKVWLALLKNLKWENSHNILTGAETFFRTLHLSLFFYRTKGASQPYIVKDYEDNHTITPVFFFNSHESVFLSSSCSRPFTIFFHISSQNGVFDLYHVGNAPVWHKFTKYSTRLIEKNIGTSEMTRLTIKQILGNFNLDQRIVYHYVTFVFFTFFFSP